MLSVGCVVIVYHNEADGRLEVVIDYPPLLVAPITGYFKLAQTFVGTGYQLVCRLMYHLLMAVLMPESLHCA